MSAEAPAHPLYDLPGEGGWIDLLNRLVKGAADAIPNLKSLKSTQQSTTAMLLYRTIIDLSRATVVCATSECSIVVPTIARQVLDAHVELKNVLATAEYVDRMFLADLEHWKESLEQANKGNEFFAAFMADPSLATDQKRYAAEIADYGRRGVTTIGIRDRFKKAGLETEYFGEWKILSAQVHNNMSSLRLRNMEETSDGRFELVSSARHTPYYGAAIVGVCNRLLSSSEAMHEKYGAGRSVFVELRKTSDVLHEATLPALPGE